MKWKYSMVVSTMATSITAEIQNCSGMIWSL